jgi:hypothetical protein
MLLPRLSALAERLWSPRHATYAGAPDGAAWPDFRRRARRLAERLAAAGYHVRPIDGPDECVAAGHLR